MFTIFMDDSGTAPKHKMAIASGIIFPALQLRRLQSEWDKFLYKEQISDFHASECLAGNPHSIFANWNDDRVHRVFARVRQIAFKYSVKGFCIAIHKKDCDEVFTEEVKAAVGDSHYTWAVSSVIGLARDWAIAHKVPMEYVFDTATKGVKRELDEAMQFIDTMFPGEFLEHFRSRGIYFTQPSTTCSVRLWKIIRGRCLNWNGGLPRRRLAGVTCSPFAGRRDSFALGAVAEGHGPWKELFGFARAVEHRFR